MLNSDTLQGILEEFVLREGTDYGFGSAIGSESSQACTLESKVEQVKRQLERGEVVVLFDEQTETCDLVSKGSKRYLEVKGAS